MKYYTTQPHLDLSLRSLIVSSDPTPTMSYYGTVTLSVALDEADADRLGLVPFTADGAEFQSDLGDLYRAETNAGA